MLKHAIFRKGFIFIFWLAIWQIASLLIDNSILFVDPLTVLSTLFHKCMTYSFWTTIISSFFKTSFGFILAFCFGILFGIFAYSCTFIRELLEPIILLMKSIPVASFVILALLWLGSNFLSIFISFMITFPILYTSTLSGLHSTDKNLLEMAQIFQMPFFKKFWYVYRPAFMPYLINACKTVLGMSWKSGIAAEVIGVSKHSIGEQLYLSKIYLDTASLFAWTLVIILISAIFEFLFLCILKQFDPSSKR